MDRIYRFGARTDGGAADIALLGGKGANLCEMARLGLPVPPGFVITTESCRRFRAEGGFDAGLRSAVAGALSEVEEQMGRRFGDRERPLLLSVRSGAPVSMPGMMDTVLNIGLCPQAVEGLAAESGNRRFAMDTWRRFIQMYADVVLGVCRDQGGDPFEEELLARKRETGAASDTDLGADDLEALAERFLALAEAAGKPVPLDPEEQLWETIGAVLSSWDNDRARVYRRLNAIPDNMGTAVNIQAMVFGNLGKTSGTGVAFTRDPATGAKRLYGEFLANAQGEDVVAGIRTPRRIEEMEASFPEAYAELVAICADLEGRYRDMLDVEFTVQEGKLWMLQCRAGKRSGFAAVRVAVEMVDEGIITESEALLRVEPEHIDHLLQPVFNPGEKRDALRAGRLLARGLPAGPGAATGRVVFTALEAEEWARRGQPVILVRPETSPDDIRGMAAARGILTVRGGLTSHAALVGRQMGKVCVVGCHTARIDLAAQTLSFGGRVLRQGNFISLDGTAGQVLDGEISTHSSEVLQVLLDGYLRPEDSLTYRYYERLMGWADERRRLGVRTNADQPDQARKALAFGAEGIGLCRTEHMFFDGDRIQVMREMILAATREERQDALDRLLPLQQADFEGIFACMEGRPVTIRLLDPPLHEFLPHSERDINLLARRLGARPAALAARVEELREVNPMLGHRGCRLGMTFPEITAMQATALFQAAAAVQARGIAVAPEVMVPLVGAAEELRLQAEVVHRCAAKVAARTGQEVAYKVGTMIELPRAAITADEIALQAEFFSFGTNDLTQMTYGLSRDDSGPFLLSYLEQGVLPENPFLTLDTTGVGYLIRLAVERGKAANPSLHLGICGEHGGDPRSISFCHDVGLDYVSCSPFRVPVARLAAAQAAIRAGAPL